MNWLIHYNTYKIKKMSNLNSYEFSKKINCSESHLSQILCGSRDFSFNLLKLICDTYNLSANWFIYGVDSIYRIPESTKEISSDICDHFTPDKVINYTFTPESIPEYLLIKNNTYNIISIIDDEMSKKIDYKTIGHSLYKSKRQLNKINSELNVKLYLIIMRDNFKIHKMKQKMLLNYGIDLFYMKPSNNMGNYIKAKVITRDNEFIAYGNTEKEAETILVKIWKAHILTNPSLLTLSEFKDRIIYSKFKIGSGYITETTYTSYKLF